MPPELKRRRQRDEKKLKAKEEASEKRRRVDDDEGLYEAPPEDEPMDERNPALGEAVFYGMLNDEEQEYFKHADDMLELNQFADAEERNLFLANVWREADDKELKLASSQSCSRLMERLILMSSPVQLKNLFQKFSGHFINLVQHRFASHCCQTLFTTAAPLVTTEMKSKAAPVTVDGVLIPSMENLFLFTVNEFYGSLGFLSMDRFASHALRALLLVLSGRPLDQTASAGAVQSKRKENITVQGREKDSAEPTIAVKPVPASFTEALSEISEQLVSKLDTSSLRDLSIHPVGNPVLQILLEIELTGDKEKANGQQTLLKQLLSDEAPLEGTEAASYITGLLYDPIGSRLLETILKFANGKTFKDLYRHAFKERIGTLARSETAGYVVLRILERISKRDLEDTMTTIIPVIPNLVERSRTVVVRTLIERCGVRATDTAGLATAIQEAYGNSAVDLLPRLLKLPEQPDEAAAKDAERLHGSLLAQTMLASPGALNELISNALLTTPDRVLTILCQDPIASHVVQKFLTSPATQPQYLRQMIPKLVPVVGLLCTHSSGSHVVDALWPATGKLEFLRERVALELVQHELEMRDSYVGRAVWRNWILDIFKRRRSDWILKAREKDGTPLDQPKTAIQLARDKFAARKAVRA